MQKRKTIFLALTVIFTAWGWLSSVAFASNTVEYKDAWFKHGLKINNSTKGGLDLAFSVEKFIFEDKTVEGKAAKSVILPGVILPGTPGAPDLPAFSRYIAVPRGAKAKVTVLSYREEKYQNVEIAPAIELPFDTDADIKPLKKDENIYSRNEFYPADFVLQSEPKKMRGIDVFILSIQPFRYNPVTKELVVRRDMKINVSFEGGEGVFGEDRYRHPLFENILKQNIINYASIQPAKPKTSGTKANEGYDYVIIVQNDPAFLSWADSIKNFRKKQGISTGIFVIGGADIPSNTTTAIETFVDSAYNKWANPPVGVLMFGDYGTTSPGLASSNLMAHPSGTSSWSYRSDNVFGDVNITAAASAWNNGGAPEIVFSRMTAQTATQCSIMVKKFMTYERQPPSSPAFYQNALSAGAFQYTRWFQLGAEICRGFWARRMGKTVNRQYSVYSATSGDINPAVGNPWSAQDPSAPLAIFGTGVGRMNYIPNTQPDSSIPWTSGSATGINNAINGGVFAVLHRDHGLYTGWGEPSYLTTNLDGLTNTSPNWPVVFSMNCQTGRFDYSSEVFSEKFHRLPGGALGVVAATEVSYSFVNDALIFGIFDGMWPNFDSTNNYDVPAAPAKYTEDLRPGFALVSGKWYLMGQSYTDAAIPADYKEFTCHLFHWHGDPFSTFCSQIPDTFFLTFNSTIPTGTQSFSVNVKNKAGQNVQSALVGLYMPTNSPEIITSNITDANGNVSFTINPQVEGPLYVTATKSNFVRKETFTTVNAGTPSKPAVTKLFDGAKLPDLRPYLTFVSTDPQNNPIDYRVIWDTTANFNSGLKDSSTTTTYASGTPVNFQFPSNLTAGRTYWWKVKGRDPAGTNMFGPESDARSFTIGTDIPAGTVCWMHTKGGQFSADAYAGAAVAQGDSVILAAPSTGSATLLSENFEGGALPSGWSTSGTYSTSYGWLIRTSGGTLPPSYGTSFEGCQFPSAGGAPSASDEIITTGQYLMNTGAVTCSLSYGYGLDPGVATDSLLAEASFLSGGSWSAWTQIDGLNNGTTTISGTRTLSLNSFMPKDGIQLRWRFSQGGGRNGQDAAIDNIILKYTYSVPNTNGTMVSGPIYYKDITKTETVSRTSYKWGKVLWRKRAAADSIGVQVEYCNNGAWALVPDGVLGGNSKGFFNQSSATDSITLVTLDTVTYDSLRVVAKLYRPASKASTNPVLYDIEFARPGFMAPAAVSLSSFTALYDNNQTLIKWRTESETDCYQWVVEKSDFPEGQFLELGRLPGAGNSNQARDYSFSDVSASGQGIYYYRIAEVNSNGAMTYYGPLAVKIGGSVPVEYSLQPAYPNPSRGTAVIKYSLKQPGRTVVKVYNVLGEEIRTLLDKDQEPGNYRVEWDGRDNNGNRASTGVYFYKLSSGNYTATRRMALIK